jgi:predicted  nucleic acid-binding Zn-ribbon protein
MGLKRDLEAFLAVGDDPDARGKLLGEQLAALRVETESKSGEITQLQKDLEATRLQLTSGGGGGSGGVDGGGGAGVTSDAEVSDLRGRMSSAEGRASSAEETVRSRDEEIGSLKRAMASTEVPELTNTDIRTLKSEREGLQRSKTQLAGDLGEAQAGLTRATAQLTQLQQQSEQLQIDATAHAADIEAKLTRDFGVKVTSLESRQKELEGELGAKTVEAARLTTELATVTGERDGLLVDLEGMKVQVAKTAVLEASLVEKEDIITTTQEQVVALTADVEGKTKGLEEAGVRLNGEIKRRKEFQFKYEEAKGKVRVYSRVRPLSKLEVESAEPMCVRAGPNPWTIELNETTKDIHGTTKDKWRPFVFDAIFQAGINGTQHEIFEECSMFGDMAVGGVNACIFAYGQSGTGKTFTMAGVPGHAELKGLKPRMIDHVFQQCAEDKSLVCNISCYMVEIYLNKLEDLMWKLDTFKKFKGKKASEWPEPPELKVRADKKRKVLIENVQMATFATPQEMHDYTDAAERMRRVRKTGLNDESSRSHLIFALCVTATDKKTGKTTNGKISLCDLAGSERADKTNVEGLSQKDRAQMLEEGTAINESLRMLKNVFRVLGTPAASDSKKGNKELVQYRGNMLTELMQDSLGGNARTLMFVNVGPAASNTSESMDSLSYGDLVKNITNEVR